MIDRLKPFEAVGAVGAAIRAFIGRHVGERREGCSVEQDLDAHRDREAAGAIEESDLDVVRRAIGSGKIRKWLVSPVNHAHGFSLTGLPLTRTV